MSLGKKQTQILENFLKKYKDERDKRDRFVDQLLKALSDPNDEVQLTFIYGKQERAQHLSNVNHTDSFVPLDGQQRLTTLFLLSWILIQKVKTDEQVFSSIEAMPKYKSFYKGLNSFCYQTRTSSEEFCSSIISEEIKGVKQLPISKRIMSQSWANDEWNLDPTVHAMLQMLDEIEEQLSKYNCYDLLVNLINGEGIKFEILDMKDYQLTDSLYVKMNARGKQLTDFENWKSEFIKFLEDRHTNTKYSGTIPNEVENHIKKLYPNGPTLKQYFEYSIEHQWTDMFWKYCQDQIKEHEKQLTQNSTKYEKDCYQFLFFIQNPDKVDAIDFQATKAEREKLFLKAFNVKLFFETLDILKELNDNNVFDNVFYVTQGNDNLQPDKVRLFDGKDVNLLTRCCLNDGSATSISDTLLFALVFYTKYIKTSVDDELKNFIRSIRNKLEGINYIGHKEVNIVNDYNINDIRKKGIYKEIFKAIRDKYCYNKSVAITEEQAKIEDIDFIYGNFAPQIKKDNTLFEVIKAWNSLDEYEKISLFIAYGFRGKSIMTCAKGELFLFGNDERWKPIFMKDSNLDTTLTSIISDYKNQVSNGLTGQWALRQLLNDKKNNLNNKFDFVYYALKYKTFLYSHAKNRNPNQYFSVKGSLDDLHLFSMVYSGKPAIAYHTDPIIFSVKEKLINQSQTNASKTLYVGYSLIGSEPPCLSIYDSFESEEPIARFKHLTGKHCSGNSGWEYEDIKSGNSSKSLDKCNDDRIIDGVKFVNQKYPKTRFIEK